jgi:putative transposase
LDYSSYKKRGLVDPEHPGLSIQRQCELLGISRSCYYHNPKGESAENLLYMRLIDEQYLDTPFYGVERMWAYLRSLKYEVNIKRIRRLMLKMGIQAIYPKPNLSKKAQDHEIYPYLLRGLKIDRVNLVWSSDITYIPMKHGYMYLVAVMDWYSRRVLSWRLSNTLDTAFCIEALQAALTHGKPAIFNTDQGSQFTSKRFTGVLKQEGIRISMDSKGRALDNVFIERLWRSLKYEDIYLRDYESGKELHDGMTAYFSFYNGKRLHSSLGWMTPDDKYRELENY